MFTIITSPLVPLRADAGDQYEMVSQLLFGQQIEILETAENWYFIKNLADGYTGWISRKSVHAKYFTTAVADTSHFSASKTPIVV